MKVKILNIFFLLLSITTYGQLNEHFIDGELSTNPSWKGDVDDFEIVDNTLHLNAEDAGSSILYTSIDFPDSLYWDLHFKMKFSPSNGNKLTIILAASTNELESQKAYYLEIGETGSNDALHFFSVENGIKHELGVGTLAALSSDPAKANLRIKFDSDKIWTISADYSGDNIFENEIEYYDNEFVPGDYHFFGVKCLYTNTRKDKFYFEHFDVIKIVADTIAPQFTRYDIIDEKHILVVFNEPLSADTNYDVTNFKLSPQVEINNFYWTEDSPNEIIVELDNPLESGTTYTMNINGIVDEHNNKSTPSSFEFELIENPTVKDIVINEVLFNPYTDGNDFLELYNNSDKTLRLDSLILRNSQSKSTVILHTNRLLRSKEYIVFTTDKASLVSLYKTSDGDRILEHKIPTMSNTNGNISLHYKSIEQMVTIDSFEYNETMHSSILDDVNGVSLERLDADGDTNDDNNWVSAATTIGYATPGVMNSIQIPNLEFGNGMFVIQTEVFSPDGDGVDPFMILGYNLDQNDYVSNITVFDIHGRLIKKLIVNEVLPTNGVIRWDGVNEEGNNAGIGIYIIKIDCLSASDKKINITKTCVLARQL